MVRLILHGELRQYAPGKVLEVHGDGLSVAEVLSAAGVPSDATAAYIVNGEQCEPSRKLHDGDTVEVLAAISGGTQGERGSGFAGPSETTSSERSFTPPTLRDRRGPRVRGRRPRDR